MTAGQYRKSDFELFAVEHGQEALRESSRRRLDAAMSEFVPYLPNTPMMVEGCSDCGSPSDEFRKSKQRVRLVREYLIGRFSLKPQNTGAMPLSDAPPEKTRKESRDGIALIVLTK